MAKTAKTKDTKPSTIGELRDSGYKQTTVRQEMRRNLIEAIKKGRTLFPGIVGYEDTVVPQIENAVLSGQDIILLGERGQAKSRIFRSLVGLLDDEIPAVAGSELNDNPFDPISRYAKDLIAENGDKTLIHWIPRKDRFGEKLATPDISVADLIGEVDPIKVAEGRYLSDELTIHYGLIPRSNRGIFCINELPDLAERIQVALFNLMEERDVQIKGYRVMLPLDVFVVASANPEDYTNRGRIITPLKDRYGAQIRTHYPRTVGEEIGIVEAEITRFEDVEKRLQMPAFMQEIIGEFTAQARRSAEINQRSGVSVRVSIANYESVISNALRRSLRLGEKHIVPRVSDLTAMHATTSGKIELESVEDGREPKVVEDLTKKAILGVFNRHFSADDMQSVVMSFEEGLVAEFGSEVSSQAYVDLLPRLDGLSSSIASLGLGGDPEATASAMEFILEGLHLNRRLNREVVGGKYLYRG
ncbi:MAG: magnesium chelatase subunit I [Chloroflexi bacterium]|jgi:magnesium chelatase subunit I|nr:MAG: magnesium chelatase subunit I [Chloroflexota bacterium]